MAPFKKSVCDLWRPVRYYDGHQIWIREEQYGVHRTCVEGFRGGEDACSGPGARERAITAAELRIDDMNNVE